MVGLKMDSNSNFFIVQHLHASFTRTRIIHIRFLHARLSHNGKSRAPFSLKSTQKANHTVKSQRPSNQLPPSLPIPISTIHFLYIIFSTELRNSLHVIRSGEHWETLKSLRSLLESKLNCTGVKHDKITCIRQGIFQPAGSPIFIQSTLKAEKLSSYIVQHIFKSSQKSAYNQLTK